MLSRVIRQLHHTKRTMPKVSRCQFDNHVERSHPNIVRKMSPDTAARLCELAEVAINSDILISIQVVAEHHTFIGHLNAKALVMSDHVVTPHVLITTVLTATIEQASIIGIKIPPEYFTGEGVSKGHAHITMKVLGPMLAPHFVSHARTVESRHCHDALMGIRTVRVHPVLHGKVRIARAKKALVVPHNSHQFILYPERETATSTEINPVAASILKLFSLDIDFVFPSASAFLFRHTKVQLRNDCHEFHFPIDGAKPVPTDFDR